MLRSVLFVSAVVGTSANIWFSEYVTGPQHTTSVTLYNGGSESVDLSSYTMWMPTDDRQWPIGIYSSLSGSLAAGSTHVICSREGHPNIQCDRVDDAVTYYNSKDMVGLVLNGALVDKALGDRPDDQQSPRGRGTIRRRMSGTVGNAEFTSSEWVSQQTEDLSGSGSSVARDDDMRVEL